MILIFALSLVGAVMVGTKADAAKLSQVQKLALYLIMVGSAAALVVIASSWHYLGV